MKHILYVIGSLIWMGTCMAANNPDDFELFQSVRQNQPQVTSLSFCNRPQLSSLDPLKYFPNLRGLRIQHCRNVKHLIPIIGTLTGLQKLYLEDNENYTYGMKQDISPFGELSNLKTLSLVGMWSQLKSIKPIVNLPIERLNLCGQHSIEDLDTLNQMTKMQRLNLAKVFFDDERTMPYPPLDFLNHMPDLTNLCLATCFMIEDLSPVWKCAKLVSLDLAGIDGRACKWNLNGIEKLINIEELILGDLHYYRDLSCLQELRKLKTLQVNCNNNEELERIHSVIGASVIVNDEAKFSSWGF